MQELHSFDDSTFDKIAALATSKDCIQHTGGATYLVVPESYKAVDITASLEKIQFTRDRKQGTATLGDIDSFIQYIKDQKLTDFGYIYADPETRTLTAVLNDNRDTATPGWRDFRAVYTAELSREFSGWQRNNKQPKEQEEFAVFIEDNIADVVEPSGEVLLAIALTLQAKTEVSFSSSRRLDNGQVQLAYTENIDARAGAGSIEIPREFSIGVRLFKNGEGYKVRARLKYRLGSGKVKFWYELDRPENAIEDAFKSYITKAQESGYTVLIGKP